MNVVGLLFDRIDRTGGFYNNLVVMVNKAVGGTRLNNYEFRAQWIFWTYGRMGFDPLQLPTCAGGIGRSEFVFVKDR